MKLQKQGVWYKVTLPHGSAHFTKVLSDAIALLDAHRPPLFILQHKQHVHRTAQNSSRR